MACSRTALIVFFGCLVAISYGQNSPPSLEEFKAIYAAAAEPELPTEPYYAEYEIEHHAGMHPSWLRRMEENLSSNPKSPGRAIVENARNRKKEGPGLSRRRIWFFGPGKWRESSDSIRHPESIADFVVDGSLRWTAGPQQAAVSNSRAGIPNGRDTAKSSPLNGAIRHLGLFYHGAIAEKRIREGMPRGVESLPDGSWIGTAKSVDGAETIRVLAEPAGQNFRFTSAQQLIEGDRNRVGQWGPDVRVTASGWTFNEFLGREIATLVEFSSGDGVLYSRYRLLEWGSIPKNVNRKAMLRVPDFNGADPIRGNFVFPELVDYRKSLHDPSIMRWNTKTEEPDEFRVANPLIPRGFSLKKWSRTIVVGVAMVTIAFALLWKRRS